MGRRWQPAFLTALRNTGNVRAACQAAQINRSTAYRAKERDEALAAKWHDAEEDYADVLRAEAHKRALQGTEVPIIHRGRPVGTKRVPSDRMLTYLLEAAERRTERRLESARLANEHGPDGRTALLDLWERTVNSVPDDENPYK